MNTTSFEAPAATPKKKSILGLIPAQLRLMQLKAQYRSGAYSGHPEEMLDAIDGVEAKIGRIRARFKPRG